MKAVKGYLIECEPSIKSIIVAIDNERNDYIIHDLDETHLLVQLDKLPTLKAKLEERLKETIPEVGIDSDSDRDVQEDRRK